MSTSDPRIVEAELTAYYDQEGDERSARPVDPRRLAARTDFLASLASELPRRVLEIGSGPGREARAFLDAGHQYLAVDLSLEHLKRCRLIARSVGRASTRALPLQTGAIDVIWTMSTLMHIPNSAIVPALHELSRVLRPGGLAAIGVWGGPDTEDSSVDDQAAGSPARLFSRRSEPRWRELLGLVGNIETFETWGNDDFPYHWAVVSKSL